MKPKKHPVAANVDAAPKTPVQKPAANVIRFDPRRALRARRQPMFSTHVLMTGGLAA